MYSLTTPVILNSQRLRFTQVLVNVKSNERRRGLFVDSVTVFDADNAILDVQNTDLWGLPRMHTFTRDEPIDIRFGLTVLLKLKVKMLDQTTL